MRCHAPRSPADRTPAPLMLQAKPGTGRRFGPAPAGPAICAGTAGFSFADVPVHAKSAPAPSRAGLPAALKAGVERLSGLAMDDVRVHRNSSEPAKLGALAYTQGSDIHLGPGQEQHLPHEAWHVVQQKQGRVTATTQMKAIGINDEVALEAEADRLGTRAAGGVAPGYAASETPPKQGPIVQLKAQPRQSPLPKEPTDPHTIDDAALQPAEQIVGDGLATKIKKAKERVQKEADKFKSDYLTAYLNLRADPTLWDDYDEVKKSSTKTYIYLPSYYPPDREVNIKVSFGFYVPIGLYNQDGMNYPEVTMSDILKFIDPEDAQSIRQAVSTKTVKVTIDAVLALVGSRGTESMRRTLKQISAAPVKAPNENLIPSGGADLEAPSESGFAWIFRLSGTVIAVGTEKLGQETVTVDRTCPKEIAVRGKYP